MQQRGLDKKEREEVDEMRRARAPVHYEVIRQEGEAELERPVASLWWSGIAAGLAISASVFSEGFLHSHLPNAEWRPLVENFGYCIGFLLVIIGGFQLFTEQTVKAILPLLSDQSWDNFTRTARLWGIVFAANMAGTFAAALFAVFSGAATSDQLNAFLEISRPLAAHGFIEAMMRGIPAGFLISALAWMMPNAEGSKFWVIVAVTLYDRTRRIRPCGRGLGGNLPPAGQRRHLGGESARWPASADPDRQCARWHRPVRAHRLRPG